MSNTNQTRPAPELPTTNRYGFPIVPCSRCGGTGRYSYNQIDGTRCFGCGGAKFRIKRGKVEKAWKAFVADALASRQAPAGTLKVGDRAALRSNEPLRTILSIEHDTMTVMANGMNRNISRVRITFENHPTTYGMGDTDLVFIREKYTVNVNDYLAQAGLAPQEGN